MVVVVLRMFRLSIFSHQTKQVLCNHPLIEHPFEIMQTSVWSTCCSFAQLLESGSMQLDSNYRQQHLIYPRTTQLISGSRHRTRKTIGVGHGSRNAIHSAGQPPRTPPAPRLFPLRDAAATPKCQEMMQAAPFSQAFGKHHQ